MPLRHGRHKAGHPRLAALIAAKSWMAGINPAMTQWKQTVPPVRYFSAKCGVAGPLKTGKNVSISSGNVPARIP
ncbi:MAG: hypothetical protein ACJ8AI_19795 [Rhodopila sp.]